MTVFSWIAFLQRLARRGGVVLVVVITVLAASTAAANEQSGTQVSILDTWPPGNHISLGRGETFYLRLAYTSDTPVRIWARPYYEGESADAGSHPSRKYSGSGEALGWFFLSQPGTRVDEIRITAGDGRVENTPEMAVWRGQIMASSKPATAATPPAWVEELRNIDRIAQERDLQEQMNQSVTAWQAILVTLFMPVVLAIGVVGLVWPFRALLRWRGGWRLGAALPAAFMTFVVLRLIIDVLLDPRSHNLWPFEILLAGGLNAAIMLCLALARTLAGRKRNTS